MVDEKDQTLPRGSIAKSQNDPPYACGFYKVLLGEVPSSFVPHLNEKRLMELGLTLNEHDERLLPLEREWLELPANDPLRLGHFAIPVYYSGYAIVLNRS